ncbi:MAG: hypothetical protein ACRC9O_00985, partial [Plesiomonas sp.]|uniref:hypothetical protein n=1 Tax=Plesiomonas sp. TaxID=2486279 RepID=UPI003F2A20F7
LFSCFGNDFWLYLVKSNTRFLFDFCLILPSYDPGPFTCDVNVKTTATQKKGQPKYLISTITGDPKSARSMLRMNGIQMALRQKTCIVSARSRAEDLSHVMRT